MPSREEKRREQARRDARGVGSHGYATGYGYGSVAAAQRGLSGYQAADFARAFDQEKRRRHRQNEQKRGEG